MAKMLPVISVQVVCYYMEPDLVQGVREETRWGKEKEGGEGEEEPALRSLPSK